MTVARLKILYSVLCLLETEKTVSKHSILSKSGLHRSTLNREIGNKYLLLNLIEEHQNSTNKRRNNGKNYSASI